MLYNWTRKARFEFEYLKISLTPPPPPHLPGKKLRINLFCNYHVKIIKTLHSFSWIKKKYEKSRKSIINIPQFLNKKHEIWIITPIPTIHVRWNVDNLPGQVFNLITDTKSTIWFISKCWPETKKKLLLFKLKYIYFDL